MYSHIWYFFQTSNWLLLGNWCCVSKRMRYFDASGTSCRMTSRRPRKGSLDFNSASNSTLEDGVINPLYANGPYKNKSPLGFRYLPHPRNKPRYKHTINTNVAYRSDTDTNAQVLIFRLPMSRQMPKSNRCATLISTHYSYINYIVVLALLYLYLRLQTYVLIIV